MAKPPPPRITLLTADEQPVIVCLCRVRRQIWRIATIDAQTGAATLGTWLNGHGFPHHSILSPSGTWLSFASTRGYTVGKPPAMDPHYIYDGMPGWQSLTFLSDSAIHSRFAEFDKSSDGSPPPFVVRGSAVTMHRLAGVMRNLLKSKEGPFTLKWEERSDAKKGRIRRFWTEPDLGVLDDKVCSAVVLVTGELVAARRGIVTCYEPTANGTWAVRWDADLRGLTGLEGCPYVPR